MSCEIIPSYTLLSSSDIVTIGNDCELYNQVLTILQVSESITIKRGSMVNLPDLEDIFEVFCRVSDAIIDNPSNTSVPSFSERLNVHTSYNLSRSYGIWNLRLRLGSVPITFHNVNIDKLHQSIHLLDKLGSILNM